MDEKDRLIAHLRRNNAGLRRRLRSVEKAAKEWMVNKGFNYMAAMVIARDAEKQNSWLRYERDRLLAVAESLLGCEDANDLALVQAMAREAAEGVMRREGRHG